MSFKWTAFRLRRARALREAGESWPSIAALLGTSTYIVRRRFEPEWAEKIAEGIRRRRAEARGTDALLEAAIDELLAWKRPSFPPPDPAFPTIVLPLGDGHESIVIQAITNDQGISLPRVRSLENHTKSGDPNVEYRD